MPDSVFGSMASAPKTYATQCHSYKFHSRLTHAPTPENLGLGVSIADFFGKDHEIYTTDSVLQGQSQSHSQSHSQFAGTQGDQSRTNFRSAYQPAYTGQNFNSGLLSMTMNNSSQVPSYMQVRCHHQFAEEMSSNSSESGVASPLTPSYPNISGNYQQAATADSSSSSSSSSSFDKDLASSNAGMFYPTPPSSRNSSDVFGSISYDEVTAATIAIALTNADNIQEDYFHNYQNNSFQSREGDVTHSNDLRLEPHLVVLDENLDEYDHQNIKAPKSPNRDATTAISSPPSQQQLHRTHKQQLARQLIQESVSVKCPPVFYCDALDSLGSGSGPGPSSVSCVTDNGISIVPGTNYSGISLNTSAVGYLGSYRASFQQEQQLHSAVQEPMVQSPFCDPKSLALSDLTINPNSVKSRGSHYNKENFMANIVASAASSSSSYLDDKDPVVAGSIFSSKPISLQLEDIYENNNDGMSSAESSPIKAPSKKRKAASLKDINNIEKLILKRSKSSKTTTTEKPPTKAVAKRKIAAKTDTSDISSSHNTSSAFTGSSGTLVSIPSSINSTMSSSASSTKSTKSVSFAKEPKVAKGSKVSKGSSKGSNGSSKGSKGSTGSTGSTGSGSRKTKESEEPIESEHKPKDITRRSVSYASTCSGSSPPSSSSGDESKDSDSFDPTDGPIVTYRRGRRPPEDDGDDESKSFVCEVCNRRFRRQEHLKRHYRSLHTQEKPFKCEKCSKTFSRSDNLTQHARTHLKSDRSSSPADNSDSESSDDALSPTAILMPPTPAPRKRGRKPTR